MIIASNFKTNHTRISTKEFLEKIPQTPLQIRIFPPFTTFDNYNLPKNTLLGAQNFYPVENGAFTGEIGKEQLDEFGLNCVLIGHSERRNVLNEAESLIIEKFNFAKKCGWEIIYCVGEPINIREEGEAAVNEYLKKQLEKIDLNYEKLIIAYEPVWAIGTGLSATLEQIKATHSEIKKLSRAPLLYGGSVNVDTILNIVNLNECDGVLIGSASWKIEPFLKMIEIVNNNKKGVI